MKKARILSLLLISAMIFCTVLYSCSEAADKDSESITIVSAEESETQDPRLSISDELPAETFDGYNFRISNRPGYLFEVWTEEEDGEIRNDALFQRNRTLEERFDIKITSINTANEEITEVNKILAANEDAFDIGLTMCFVTGTLITNGYLVNWYGVEHINLDKPWWINGINNRFSMGGAVYTVVGDTCLSTLNLTYAVMYNKRLANEYQLPDLYEKVRTNEWTIDYFIGITKDVYSDLNGNTVSDEEDFYSFTAETATNLDVYPFAFNIPIIGQDEEGYPEIVINSDRMLAAIEKVNELYWSSTGSFIAVAPNYERAAIPFMKYNAIFNTRILWSMYGEMREFEDEYGVLPYPKWDENQEIYMTGTMDRYSVIILPKTNTDIRRTGIITEALNAESYKTLFPAWYEDSAQNKFARDEGTIEMLDIIMKGRNFDTVTLFSNNWSSLPWMFRDIVAKNTVTLPSKWASAEKSSVSALEKIKKAYIENAA